jgi:hypothetical protein
MFFDIISLYCLGVVAWLSDDLVLYWPNERGLASPIQDQGMA